MNDHKDNVFFMAKVSFEMERYDDVIMQMKKYIEIDSKLTEEQMDILAQSYREIVCSYREIIWKINESHDKTSKYEQYKQFYREKLNYYCTDFISLIETKLQNQENGKRRAILLLKCEADYSRYLIECQPQSQKCFQYEKISNLYNNALDLCSNLECYDELLLRVALSYSVFLHDVVGKKKEGLDMMSKYFQVAVNELDRYVCIDPYPSKSVLVLDHMKMTYHDWLDELIK